MIASGMRAYVNRLCVYNLAKTRVVPGDKLHKSEQHLVLILSGGQLSASGGAAVYDIECWTRFCLMGLFIN